MTTTFGLFIFLLFNSLVIVTVSQNLNFNNQLNINKKQKEESRNDFRRDLVNTDNTKRSETKIRHVRTENGENLNKVTIEVQRLFDSFDKKRSGINIPDKENNNEDEVTIVIENDGSDDNDDDDDDRKVLHDRDYIEKPVDQSGFSIILDSTKDGMKESSDDFASLSRSYDRMRDRFNKYLLEEKQHLPTLSSKMAKFNRKTDIQKTQNEEKPNNHQINKLKKNSLIVEDDNDENGEVNQRSNIEEKNQQNNVKDSKVLTDESKLPFSNPSPRSLLLKTPTKKLQRHLSSTLKSPSKNLSLKRLPASELRDRNSKLEEEKRVKNREFDEKIEKKLNTKPRHDNYNNSFGDRNINHDKQNEKQIQNKSIQELHNNPTERRIPDAKNNTQLIEEKNAKTDEKVIKNMNNESSVNINKRGEKIVHARKAEAMLEYLNKDPLESWIFKFTSLKELGLNSTMLRNGLVNAGSIDRLKNVMKRALKGKDVIISIIGGSISAGGGLYKDEESIAGLYYKGLVDWWNKAITPLTGSEMKVNNVAIGAIGTDYFSYCLKSHVKNETDIILWELSGNDYNRYIKQPTKGARPLERFTRMALMLQHDPAVLYVNFFKGVDYKKSKKTCPNFEDQGEDIVAHYYKIPSLSWRAMICEPLIENKELFNLQTLFCKDQYHPSLRAHAQMALLLILHLRHVMRSVLQLASSNDGYLPNFTEFYTIPPPLFLGLEFPTPLCWTLITPDFKESIYDSLDMKILTNNGFKLEYATNFPIRFDRVICWKAEMPDAFLKIQFYVPDNLNKKTVTVNDDGVNRKSELAITTHTRFGGSAEIWLDQKPDNPLVLKEGRETDTGKRTQVDLISKSLEPGVHSLNIKAKNTGFCLSSIMVD